MAPHTWRVNRAGLWGHSDFLKLWIAQTVSVFGSEVSGLAIPLTAVLTLGATPSDMGLLRAVEGLPFLVVGLFAGVWIDRSRRRPILIASDLGRAILLSSIPIAALLHRLSLPQLYVVGFLTGTLGVFFHVAYGSYLPGLVGRTELVEANGKLELSRSAAQIAGPGLAGVLVGWLTAPVAVGCDAVSFLVSVIGFVLVRTPESAPTGALGPEQAKRPDDSNIWREIAEGLRLVIGTPILRAMTGSAAFGNFFASMLSAIFILYLTREVGLSPAVMGLGFGAIGPGALVGSLLAARLPRRIGLGRSMVGASLVLWTGNMLNALITGPVWLAVSMLVAGQFLIGCSAVVLNVNLVSLSQTITPNHLLGRLRASSAFVTAGAMPLGAFAGGVLGTWIDLRPTLLVAGVGALGGFIWLVLSPIRTLHTQPTPESPEET